MTNLAIALAKTILNGFERHIYLFSEITRAAQSRFEQRQWHDVQLAARARTDYYDQRVLETLSTIKEDFRISGLNVLLWQQVKNEYLAFLNHHPQAELAESFYNSVFCHLFERKYYHNAFIFVESCLASPLLEAHNAIEDNSSSHSNALHLPKPKIFERFYPHKKGMYQTVQAIIDRAGFNVPFAHLKADIHALMRAFAKQSPNTRFETRQLQIDILNSVFYRNKGAYIIGRVISPKGETPFIVPIINNHPNGLTLDALLIDSASMAVVFGFARAYFFVDCLHPQTLVDFLQNLIPHKTRADLYSAIGYHKQGKTQFYRDFLHHLAQSDDKFQLAEGIKGMVMSVFTLPSYPYVFKLIKDKFAPSKSMSRSDVKTKYRLVKLHDRVGRMADTMEYSEVAFPKNRFSDALLTELLNVAASSIQFEEDLIIIKHLYIERRMTPLNIYLSQANEQQIEEAMNGYGLAIKQLIAANIFPGDMLLKNFGVTRHGRVIFYDYDEIVYMNQVNFRVKPEPVTEEQIFAAEPWYSVAPGDVFPEEIATFALANPAYRNAFLKHHADLLDAKYWQHWQNKVAQGYYADVFPYPDSLKLGTVQAIKN